MQQPVKTIIIDVAPAWLTSEELENRMNELESLVSTYGWVTIVKRVQKKHTPDYRTFIGSGKLDEIIAIGSELWAELLIIGNIMKSAQVWNTNEYLRKQNSSMQVWDKVDLILKIFSEHAVSPESKLQVELAAIKHMGPRIFGMGMELSRQCGGSRNAKWQWETNTEIMKRHLKEKERIILEKLKTHERTRELHREHRKRNNFFSIGIVGYTNAGKSSLFNVLTKKWVLAEDKLFATLGTSVGKIWLWNSQGDTQTSSDASWDTSSWEYIPYVSREVLISDTIGFIKDMPPNLIAAFRSTLEDSIQSDILLHVVDGSDRDFEEKIRTVDETLNAIGATNERIIIINKSDAIEPSALDGIQEKYPFIISTYTAEWIEWLKEFLRIRSKNHY